MKCAGVKKQENGDKDENFMEVKEKDEDFPVKEETTDVTLSENGGSSVQIIGAHADRDARLIGSDNDDDSRPFFFSKKNANVVRNPLFFPF